MKVSRGAQSAISSCASTGRSPAFLLPKVAFDGAVLQEVAGHPVVLAGAGEVLDRFAPVAAMQLGAAFAGRSDQHDREARVERHRDERGLAVARDAFDADLLRVDRLVGLEIVETARRAPGPGAQRAPVVRLARLALVDQADDALRQARAVVGLDAAGVERRVAPAVGDQLLGRRRIAARRWCDAGPPGPPPRPGGRRIARQRAAAAEHDHHRHRALGVGRRDERHLDVDGDRRDTPSCPRARRAASPTTGAAADRRVHRSASPSR